MPEKSQISEKSSIQTITTPTSSDTVSLSEKEEVDVLLTTIPKMPSEEAQPNHVGLGYYPTLELLVPTEIAETKTINLQGVLNNLKIYFQSRITKELARPVLKNSPAGMIGAKTMKLLDELLAIIQIPGIDDVENEAKLLSVCCKCPSILAGIINWPNGEKLAVTIAANNPELFSKLPEKLRKSEHYGKLLLENNNNLGEISSLIPKELIDVFAKNCVKNSDVNMLIVRG